MLCPHCMDKFGVGARLGSRATIDEIDAAGEDSEYDLCPFCAKTAVSDDTLLTFALKKLDMSKEALTEMYKATPSASD